MSVNGTIEIHMPDGEAIEIVSSQIVAFGPSARYGERGLDILLVGGDRLVSTHDSRDTFRARLSGARGGTPIHCHVLAEKDRVLPPAPPLEPPEYQTHDAQTDTASEAPIVVGATDAPNISIGDVEKAMERGAPVSIAPDGAVSLGSTTGQVAGQSPSAKPDSKKK